MDPVPSAPPRYSEVARPNETYMEGQQYGAVESLTDEVPQASNQPSTHTYEEPIPPLDNNFDIVRFILCWTGLATEMSSATCCLCGSWYMLIGAYGMINIFLPYILLYQDWPHSLIVWYMLAGISCVFLCLMWCCTLRFFYRTHPYKRLHDSRHYRVPAHVNTGSIVCCFLLSCAMFGGVTTALFHNIIFIIHVDNIPFYVVFVTVMMCIILFTFLCLNCSCYFHFVRTHAGNIC